MAMYDDSKRKTMSIEEAARHLGISRGVAYEAAHAFLDSDGTEGLPVLRLGQRRLVVPVARLEQMLGCSLTDGDSSANVVRLHPAPNSETVWATSTLAPTGTRS